MMRTAVTRASNIEVRSAHDHSTNLPPLERSYDKQGARRFTGCLHHLTADHKKVHALFKEFSKLKEGGSDEDKASIVDQVCNELTIHATLEEEIFYPAVRKAIEDGDLMTKPW